MTTRRRKTGRSQSSDALFSLLGHRFQNPDLLTWALTHRSLAYETNPETLPNPGSDNEQLEFVGDAVLGLAVAESLFQRFPGSREGELTRLRASLVSRRHLGHVAARIDLGAWLRLGRGEEQSGGRQKLACLTNALEDGAGGSRALAESEGTTKKQAQQEAARIAFELLLSEQRTSGDATGGVEVAK